VRTALNVERGMTLLQRVVSAADAFGEDDADVEE
jgi:hypothetical protein